MAESDDVPQLPWVSGDGGTGPRQPAAEPPEIEGYRIIGPLGQGGMGTVWRAVQESTRREVALKVLGWGALSSERTRARFEREVALASRLEHPHIARVYDSGLYHGAYYYSMELVEGVPLDEYVTAHPLDRREILSLVRTVCRAVQHAHQRSMIHRDLKPSNILVTADGQPHVLDFGLAKAFLEEEAPLTVSIAGDVVGTPAYMSPEQAAGWMDRVDTRSDVYSLGVIAYQLLTGVFPHNLAGTRPEVLRRVAEEEPRRPREVVRGMDGELEALLLKALAHDADARYASAGDLADDLDRYLAGEPLLAKRPTTLYFLRKRLWKYRVPVSLACGILVALAAVAVWSYDRVVRARDVAKQEAAKATAVTEFMDETFASTDPAETLGRDVTVRDMLDKATQRVDAKFRGQPLLEAAIRDSLAVRYTALGAYEPARAHLARAVAIRKQLLGERHADTLEALGHLGRVLRLQGKTAEAKALLTEVLDRRLEILGKDHPDTRQAMSDLAKTLVVEGKGGEGEALQRQAIAAAERSLGKEHPDVLALTALLGDILWQEGKRDQAVRTFRQVVEARLKVLGQDHPDTISSMDCLASALWDQGERSEALGLYRQVESASRRSLGEDHPGTLQHVTKLADALAALGAHEEAERVRSEEVRLRHRTAKRELSASLISLNELANNLRGQGKFSEAQELHRAVLRVQQRSLGEEHPQTLASESNVAEDLYCQQDFQGAELLHRKVLAVRGRTQGEDAPETILVARDLAHDLFRQHKYVEAQELYSRVLEAFRKRSGTTGPETLRAVEDLAAALEAQGRKDEASELRKGTGGLSSWVP